MKFFSLKTVLEKINRFGQVINRKLLTSSDQH